MDGARAAFENLVTTAPSALAYVHFMRFIRRVDGASAARKAFARCRKDPAVTADTAHITYIAAAHIEYFLNKESRIARNVFELGAFLAWASSCRICMVAALLFGGSGVARCLQWVCVIFRHPILFLSSSAFAEWCPRSSRCCHLRVGWGGVLVSAPLFSPVDYCYNLLFCPQWTIALARRPAAGYLPTQLIQELPMAFSLLSVTEVCLEECLFFLLYDCLCVCIDVHDAFPRALCSRVLPVWLWLPCYLSCMFCCDVPGPPFVVVAIRLCPLLTLLWLPRLHFHRRVCPVCECAWPAFHGRC